MPALWHSGTVARVRCGMANRVGAGGNGMNLRADQPHTVIMRDARVAPARMGRCGFSHFQGLVAAGPSHSNNPVLTHDGVLRARACEHQRTFDRGNPFNVKAPVKLAGHDLGTLRVA